MSLYIKETDHQGNVKTWEARDKPHFCEIVQDDFRESESDYDLYRELTVDEYLQEEYGDFEDRDQEIISFMEEDWLLALPGDHEIWITKNGMSACRESEFKCCYTYLKENLKSLEITDEYGDLIY